MVKYLGTKSVDWFAISLELHKKYKGKIEVVPKVPVTKLDDFSVWYTPGVASPCKRIHEEGADFSFDYTLRWNYAAVVSDGTRVLGLGNIGPEAALPVMEGKALLFKYLGGVDAVPLVIRERDPEKFIYIVKALEPSFGAINLEDIESPKCFYILEKLQEILEVPVWHDDQQGTALVNIAALMNALKIVGKKISEVKIALVGVGAANIALYKYLKVVGANPKNIVAVDSKGILHRNRHDIEKLKEENPWKYAIAVESNGEGVTGGIRESMRGADVVIAASTPGPGVIKKEWIREMNNDAIVFAEANPIPEIWPWEAKEGGARIVATGRSDFPNQINNSLGFPAVFRGVLSVRARKMVDEMFVAAAYALARYAEEKGIHEEYIIPRMDEEGAYIMEAMAVAEKAMELGLARRTISRSELESEIRELIERPKKYTKLALGSDLIAVHPPFGRW
ncbi:MAG: NADP-dependent malic enzyme [Sulfolobales archaeon]